MAEGEEQGLLRRVKEKEQFLALNKPKNLPLRGPVTQKPQPQHRDVRRVSGLASEIIETTKPISARYPVASSDCTGEREVAGSIVWSDKSHNRLYTPKSSSGGANDKSIIPASKNDALNLSRLTLRAKRQYDAAKAPNQDDGAGHPRGSRKSTSARIIFSDLVVCGMLLPREKAGL